MFDIELPCCGGHAVLDRTTDAVECEACGVVLELAADPPEALPAAA